MAERKKELNRERQRRFRERKRKHGYKLTWVRAPPRYGSERIGAKIPVKPLRKLKLKRRLKKK